VVIENIQSTTTYAHVPCCCLASCVMCRLLEIAERMAPSTHLSSYAVLHLAAVLRLV